jgi:hypothetical protein
MKRIPTPTLRNTGGQFTLVMKRSMSTNILIDTGQACLRTHRGMMPIRWGNIFVVSSVGIGMRRFLRKNPAPSTDQEMSWWHHDGKQAMGAHGRSQSCTSENTDYSHLTDRSWTFWKYSTRLVISSVISERSIHVWSLKTNRALSIVPGSLVWHQPEFLKLARREIFQISSPSNLLVLAQWTEGARWNNFVAATLRSVSPCCCWPSECPSFLSLRPAPVPATSWFKCSGRGHAITTSSQRRGSFEERGDRFRFHHFLDQV